jgi:hypothetical protein
MEYQLVNHPSYDSGWGFATVRYNKFTDEEERCMMYTDILTSFYIIRSISNQCLMNIKDPMKSLPSHIEESIFEYLFDAKQIFFTMARFRLLRDGTLIPTHASFIPLDLLCDLYCDPKVRQIAFKRILTYHLNAKLSPAQRNALCILAKAIPDKCISVPQITTVGDLLNVSFGFRFSNIKNSILLNQEKIICIPHSHQVYEEHSLTESRITKTLNAQIRYAMKSNHHNNQYVQSIANQYVQPIANQLLS